MGNADSVVASEANGEATGTGVLPINGDSAVRSDTSSIPGAIELRGIVLGVTEDGGPGASVDEDGQPDPISEGDDGEPGGLTGTAG